MPSGGYFTLENKSGKAVTLTGADSPACGMLMLHKSDDKGGMSSMSDVTEVPVPAGTSQRGPAVLVIGCSGGYGLAAAAAGLFGHAARTIGVCYEKNARFS